MNQEKRAILADLLHYRETRPARFWASIGVASTMIFGMVAAFGTAPDTVLTHVAQKDYVEELKFGAAPENPALDAEFVREEQIRRGDTAASLFSRLGMDGPATVSALSVLPGADVLFRQIAPGKTVTARIDRDGLLQSLVFPLNSNQGLALFVQRQGNTFTFTQKSVAVDTQVVMKSATIQSSLFGATDAADIPDSVATQLADIFSGDIDFHRDLRRGDRFSVVYESISAAGKPIRMGRILAAEFTNAGKQFSAIWFGDAQGSGGYYSPDGRSLRKAFLRSPLEFSRVTSGFTASRFHPVLQRWRAHKGVDYAAPPGTRVRATADGVVAFAGNQGGYGKVVILKHQTRYSTLYGHLSGFAAGLKAGRRVAQGEVIAYTGATGLASGPHLHYEFRVDGSHKNPLTVALPGAPPLAPQQLAKFRQVAALELTRINKIREFDLTALD
ncbi:hypothetical protein B9N43_13965 [Denitratisoma sp. DHT3]|uniref:M23 family metallopeptidase n=1 Tax=Denitratisoma sp. DHT3 TaxID=1981880 RepID=UPI00119833C1|nr:M23 family metallopeptidase [Denitratisoma sp. DHT3]QDX82254.1 hypothetical protein B9N43_13965 [Denitratisoma sp. DHT3]